MAMADEMRTEMVVWLANKQKKTPKKKKDVSNTSWSSLCLFIGQKWHEQNEEKNKEEEKSMACVNSIRSLIVPSAALCNHSMAFLASFFFEGQKNRTLGFYYANWIVKPLHVPCIHIVVMVNSYFKRKKREKKEINGRFCPMQLTHSEATANLATVLKYSCATFHS